MRFFASFGGIGIGFAIMAGLAASGCCDDCGDDEDDVDVETIQLFVDAAVTSVPSGPNAGSQQSPFPRISDALARARAVRASTFSPIEIFVRPGTYAAEPRPLVLDVQGTSLIGGNPLPRDAGGFPVAPAAADETRIASPLGVSGPAEPVILVADDFMTVANFTIDADPAASGPGAGPGIFVDGTRDVDGVVVGIHVHDIFVLDASVGILARHASGVFEANLLSGNGTGAAIAAGPQARAAFVEFRTNRASGNAGHGASFAGDTQSALAPATFSDPGELVVDVVGNEISGNGAGSGTGAGLRFAPFDAGADLAHTAAIFAFVSGNRIDANARYGVLVEHVSPESGGACAQNLPALFSASFSGNALSVGGLNGVKDACLTFTTAARTVLTGTPGHATEPSCYVESSVIDVTDSGDVFGSHHLDAPVLSPDDGRALGDALTLNGVRIEGFVESPVP